MILFFFAISFLTANATEKPVCDSKAVSRNCEFFNEQKDRQFIFLEDGTWIRNPVYKEPAEEVAEKPSSETTKKQIAAKKAKTEKAEVLQSEIFDAFANTNFSTRFKIQYPSVIYASDPNGEVNIPWPPDVKDAPKTSVKVSRIENYLRKSMSPLDFQLLEKKGAELKELYSPELKAEREETIKAIEEEKFKVEFASNSTKQRNHKLARIKDIFIEAQDQLVKTISRGKKENELSEEQKMLIEKIKTIRLGEGLTEQAPSCQRHEKNASYSQLTHTFSFCPEAVMATEANIALIIGHEIGHAIDPCRSRMPLWRVDSAKLKEFMKNSKLSDYDKKDLESTFAGEMKFINLDLETLLENPSLANKLENEGVIELVHAGVPIDRYPFEQEFKCMVRKNGFKKTGPEDIKATVRYLGDKANFSTTEKSFRRASMQRYQKALKKYPECFPTTGPLSTTGEVMADVFGTIVEEKHILENPFKSEGEKVLSLEIAVTACAKQTPPLSASVKSAAPLTTKAELSSLSFLDPHPDDDQRVQRINLNSPGMAEIYNCRRTVPACFDHLSTYNQRSKSSSPRAARQGTN